jgi:hypothetical protein
MDAAGAAVNRGSALMGNNPENGGKTKVPQWAHRRTEKFT